MAARRGGADWRHEPLEGQKSASITACLAADRLFQRQSLSVISEPSLWRAIHPPSGSFSTRRMSAPLDLSDRPIERPGFVAQPIGDVASEGGEHGLCARADLGGALCLASDEIVSGAAVGSKLPVVGSEFPDKGGRFVANDVVDRAKFAGRPVTSEPAGEVESVILFVGRHIIRKESNLDSEPLIRFTCGFEGPPPGEAVVSIVLSEFRQCFCAIGFRCVVVCHVTGLLKVAGRGIAREQRAGVIGGWGLHRVSPAGSHRARTLSSLAPERSCFNGTSGSAHTRLQGVPSAGLIDIAEGMVA